MGKNKEVTMARLVGGVLEEEFDAFMYAYPELSGVAYSYRYKNLSDWDILSIAKMAALTAIEKGYGKHLKYFIEQEMFINEHELLCKRMLVDNRSSGEAMYGFDVHKEYKV